MGVLLWGDPAPELWQVGRASVSLADIQTLCSLCPTTDPLLPREEPQEAPCPSESVLPRLKSSQNMITGEKRNALIENQSVCLAHKPLWHVKGCW